VLVLALRSTDTITSPNQWPHYVVEE